MLWLSAKPPLTTVRSVSASRPQIWIYGNDLIGACSKNASYIRCWVSSWKLNHKQAWVDAIISNTPCSENPMLLNREIWSLKPQLITCFLNVGVHDRSHGMPLTSSFMRPRTNLHVQNGVSRPQLWENRIAVERNRNGHLTPFTDKNRERKFGSDATKRGFAGSRHGMPFLLAGKIQLGQKCTYTYRHILLELQLLLLTRWSVQQFCFSWWPYDWSKSQCLRWIYLDIVQQWMLRGIERKKWQSSISGMRDRTNKAMMCRHKMWTRQSQVNHYGLNMYWGGVLDIHEHQFCRVTETKSGSTTSLWCCDAKAIIKLTQRKEWSQIARTIPRRFDLDPCRQIQTGDHQRQLQITTNMIMKQAATQYSIQPRPKQPPNKCV